MDALLLSRCDHHIKTKSLVSDYAMYRNPAMACDVFSSPVCYHHKNQGLYEYFQPPSLPLTE